MFFLTKLTGVCALGVTLMAGSALAADAAAGKAAFDKTCKTCHGADGAGNQKLADMMKVTMRPLASKEIQAMPDADLKTIVTKGKGKMRPVASLSAKDVDDVVAYVKTLK